MDIRAGIELETPYKHRIKRPYILVERKYLDDEHRYQIFEKLDLNDAEAMTNAMQDAFKENVDAGIVYQFNNTYQNHEEIMELEREAMKNKIPEIDNESFQLILNNSNTLACIYIYNEVEQLTDKVYSNLAQFNEPMRAFIMNASILIEHFPNDKDIINKILSDKDGKYMFFPFGDAQKKKDQSLIFDQFNSNQVVGAYVSHCECFKYLFNLECSITGWEQTISRN